MSKNIHVFKAKAKLVEKFRVDSLAGKHSIVIDEPPELGGTGMGPNPVELLLASLASCLVIATSFHAMMRKIKIKSIEADAEGILDLRGFMGTDENIRPGFKEIKVILKINSDEQKEKLEELIKFVENHCPVRDTLLNGTNIKLEVKI